MAVANYVVRLAAANPASLGTGIPRCDQIFRCRKQVGKVTLKHKLNHIMLITLAVMICAPASAQMVIQYSAH